MNINNKYIHKCSNKQNNNIIANKQSFAKKIYNMLV